MRFVLPGWLGPVFKSLSDLWERAKRERSTPKQIGLAVGAGAFVACTPFVGFHLGIAFALATLLRLNRLWAMIGSRMSTTPVFLATTFCEIEVAHRFRTGAFTSVRIHDLGQAREFLGDWFLGTVLVGVPIALVTGAIAGAIAARWQRLSLRKLDEARLPSSESPP